MREFIARYRRRCRESCVREAKRGENNEPAKPKRLRFPYHAPPSIYIRLKHQPPPQSRVAIEFDGVTTINQLAKTRRDESSRDFHIVGTADVFAFLALEPERLGAPAPEFIMFSAYGNAKKKTTTQGPILSHNSHYAIVVTNALR